MHNRNCSENHTIGKLRNWLVVIIRTWGVESSQESRGSWIYLSYFFRKLNSKFKQKQPNTNRRLSSNNTLFQKVCFSTENLKWAVYKHNIIHSISRRNFVAVACSPTVVLCKHKFVKAHNRRLHNAQQIYIWSALSGVKIHFLDCKMNLWTLHTRFALSGLKIYFLERKLNLCT